ncbi:MAG: FxLYD domain-containing protein [Muribaculaceae bacterium]|nr:FxLYD domain-containing protein [Muribaculaceae bacterium]
MTTLRNLAIIATLLTLCPAAADRVVTTRKNLKPAETAPTPETSHTYDTLVSPTGAVRFCGYEKTIRASKETLFIENKTDSAISSISLTIEYIDNTGRQIHRRSLRQTTDIPPHQTRRYDIRSWDTQKTYYYKNGEQPRKSATPYDIRITTDTIFIQPCTR